MELAEIMVDEGVSLPIQQLRTAACLEGPFTPMGMFHCTGQPQQVPATVSLSLLGRTALHILSLCFTILKLKAKQNLLSSNYWLIKDCLLYRSQSVTWSLVRNIFLNPTPDSLNQSLQMDSAVFTTEYYC